MNHSIKYKVAQAALAFSLVVGGLSYAAAPTTYAAEASVVSQQREVTWGVNMRSGPSTSYAKVKMLAKGETVTVIGQASNGWYNVQDRNGKIGYISNDSKYTKLISSTSSSNSSSSNSNNTSNSSVTAPSTQSTATIQRGVSFRTGPSTSYKRMRYLQTGEQVTVLGKSGSWYNVQDSSGTKGYVSSSSTYIKLNNGSVSTGDSTNTGSNSGSNTGSNTGSNSGSSSSGSSTTSSAAVEKVIAAGMKYLGTPYEYGSNRNTTTTFDCSDFVRQAFKDALGITLPADSRKQGAYVKELGNAKTSISQLKRGDLMFFMSYKGSSKSSYSGVNKSTARITHVGIYLGDGKILHTYSKDSGGVKTDTITGKHWEYRFLYGGSALK